MNNQLPNHSDGVTLNLDELLQYKAQSVRWLPPAKSLWSQLNGQHESNRKGRGMNFSEVRQYQAGDDIRSIDWRVTARTGKAHTKLFSEERAACHFVLGPIKQHDFRLNLVVEISSTCTLY